MIPKNNRRTSYKPDIEQIEDLLKSFRPEPVPGFPKKTLRKDFFSPISFREVLHSVWRKKLAVGLVILALTIILIPFGDTIAQSISRFFRFAEESERVHTVSLTPRPSPNPEYPYSEFTLSKIQAEAQAGFAVRTIQSLSDGWQFHNYRYEPELNSVEQLYTYSSQEKPGVYLYLRIQSDPFESDWGFCPNGTLFEVAVSGLPAEILSGAVWATDSRSTPGVTQEWQCEAVDNNLVQILRWVEDPLHYEISVTQFETISDITITHQDLILMAEGMR